MAPTAIVFTGQPDRIERALELMEEGRVARILVSGANRPGGVDPTRFARQFRLSPRLVSALSAGDIVLATEANSTLENAIETSCWLSRHPEIDEVTLITSSTHMARASLALERALHGRVEVRRLTSDRNCPTCEGPKRLPLAEFGTFLATWLITLLPQARWTPDPPRLGGAASLPEERIVFQGVERAEEPAPIWHIAERENDRTAHPGKQ
ncbi:YdcF family protein [Ancylobacter polymorphus]|uniref:YdcF family protein n=1 Tax=Ancylobacter polymorphus TaxID=223390 RepID=A0A9E7AAQ1_9HYPH|nr:YdcF family protein [Ancylobacter polymorphus]UOK72813.1 YdcF family protein [Ancylobacter polymorphus]